MNSKENNISLFLRKNKNKSILYQSIINNLPQRTHNYYHRIKNLENNLRNLT